MNRWDILAIAGALIASAGVAVIYWPAGLIVLGVGLIGLGVVGALSETRVPAKSTEPPGGTKL